MREHSFLKVLAAILVISTIPHLGSQAASAQTFQSCMVEDEDTLFIKLQERARNGYSVAHQEFDFEIHVGNAWRSAGMTSIIGMEATEAGIQYGGEGFLEREANRRLTSYSRSRAEAAVEKIADQTFSSTAVREALEVVVEGSVDRFLTYLSRRSEDVAIDMGQCFSEFLSMNFPPIVRSAATQHFASIQETLQIESPGPQVPGLELTTPGVLGTTLVALGAVRRQIVTRITGQVAGRVAARLATRAIPYVGWALVGFEVIWQRDGSLPEIVESMTGPAIIQGLQVEIAREIKDEVKRQIPQISQEIVRATMDDWRSFVADNETVLALSQTNARFRRYLDQFSSNEDLAPVRNAVVLIVRLGGEETLNDIIDRNQMSAVLRLSAPGQQLAKETNSLETALQWGERAPNRLNEVLKSELYKMKSPTELSAKEIDFILNLSDQRLIRSAALLPSDDVGFLSSIDRSSAEILLGTLPEDRTPEAVGALRTIVAQDAKNTIFRYLSVDRYQSETLIADLRAVGASKDQDLAANLIFSPPSFLGSITSMRIPQSVQAALAGDVSWRLLLRAYHLQIVALGVVVLSLIVFGWIRRPRRQEVVIRHEKQD